MGSVGIGASDPVVWLDRNLGITGGFTTVDRGQAKLDVRTRLDVELGLNTASEANWGQFDNRGYGTEVIYSATRPRRLFQGWQDMAGMDRRGAQRGWQWQVEMECRAGSTLWIWLCEDLLGGDCDETNQDCVGEF